VDGSGLLSVLASGPIGSESHRGVARMVNFKRAGASICCSALLLALFALTAPIVSAAPNVLTAAYNNLRDGWDSSEPALSPSAVQSSSFGELFSTRLDGAVYAQPLVFDGTVIVTTEKANAYGVNASTGAIEWHRSFGNPFKSATIGCSDLKPYMGSTSTPVIDPSTGTIYLTTRLQEGKGLAGAHWYLQALSASTGAERPGFPVQIAGTPYNTPGVPFNESFQLQRPGLLLLNGVVYVAFASACDITPYRGIVVGMSASTGVLTTMWSDESGVGTDENSQAGIWQSGAGLVSDIPGRIILTSGNGVSPQPAASGAPPSTLSESVIGLTVGSEGRISPSQFFAPSNAPTLDQNDEDLGSGGPVALPTEYFGTAAHPHLVVQVGKDGRVFLIDADNMGGYRQGPGKKDAVLQTLGPFAGVWGHPAVYGGQGGWVYVLESAGGGFLRAISYGVNGSGIPQLTSAGTSSEPFGYTSGSPLVTSNGTRAGSAVVWVVYVSNASEKKAENGDRAQLRAYSATPTGGNLPLLWSGSLGKASKFSVPTAYEGRVYVGTRDGRLIAFGSSPDAPLQAPAVDLGSVAVGQSRGELVRVSVTRPLRLTGAVTDDGVETIPGSDTDRAAPEDPRATGLTAGPSVLPASGTAALAAGVITVSQPAVGSAFSAGATIELHVRFRPMRAGPIVGSITVHTSAGARSVAISGYGTQPGLLLSAQPLQFGTIETRAGGKQLAISISNSWTQPERLTGFELPRGPYTVSGLPVRGTILAPREAITVSVSFNPPRAGSYPSRLTIRTNQGTSRIPIGGSARTGEALLSADARHLEFGAVRVGQHKTLTLAVGNRGNVPLTITRAIAPEAPFLTSNPLPEGVSLDPGTFVHLKITFAPTTRGRAIGVYHLNGTDGRGPLTVNITGNGI
jgi:hypothetical protein